MNVAPAMTQTEPRVVLTARGLGKDFAGFTAVNNVDLDVEHARIHALIGPNGAGKTTVFNLLTKFLQPTRGKIALLGQDITQTKPDKVARMGLVRSFQISAVFPHLTVRENVKVALQRPAGLAVQFWKPLSSLDRLNARADELIDHLGLTPYRDHRAADLDPEVLLLDEPMAGMGQEDVRMVAEIIRDVARTRAVLMVEHNLTVVADICHHVTVLQRGEIIATGDYASVSADPRVRTAYMGTEA
jgi:branched-chain amino acid transport system ATP-binding protein